MGLFLGNIYELYAAMFMALFVSGWSSARFADRSFQNGSLDYLFLCAACVPQLFYIGISWNLYKEYAWVLYRKAGADVMLRGLYIKYLLWSCLLKLDTVFGILATFLSGRGVCNGGILAFFDYATLFICIIFLFMGYYVVQRELVMYTRIWFFLFPFLPAHNIGFLIYSYKFQSIDPTQYTEYILRALFTAVAVCSLVTWVGLVYFTFIVYNNYGKGLVTLAEERKKRKEKQKSKTKITTEDDEDDSESDYANSDYQNYDNNNNNNNIARNSEDGWSLKDVIANTYALEDGNQRTSAQVKKY